MRFLSYIRRYYRVWAFLGYMGLCLLSGLLSAAQIRLRGNVIDAALAGAAGGGGREFAGQFALYALILGICAAVTVLLQRGGQKHNSDTGFRLDARRVEKANAVRFDVTETGQFHTLLELSRQAPALDEKLYAAMQTIFLTGSGMAASIGVLLAIDPWTVAGILLLLAAGMGLNICLARRSDGFWGRYMENMRFTNYLASLLLQREYSGERKLFGFGREIGARFQSEFEKAKGENQALGRGRLRIEAVLELFSAAYSVAVVLLLLRPLTAGTISIGLFTSAFYAANGLRKSCSQLYDAIFSLFSSWKQMGAFFSFLDLPEEAADGQTLGEEPITIEFRDVGFTYPGETAPVLEHISFTLTPGRHYALVGENGSGKTTLAKLLVGLYQPTHGEILLGGRPAGELSRQEKQRIFSAVFQDFYRYPLSIRENVTLGMEKPVGDAEIQAVFRALDFAPAVLRQPGGMDRSLQLMQEDSAGLSGGEWQKLAIARCVLSQRQAAVLDEPNAALDPIAEAEVYRAYRELLGDKTTLFISHRLGSVKLADEILVLKDRRLLARGSHERLMAACPYYASLYETQRRMYYAG